MYLFCHTLVADGSQETFCAGVLIERKTADDLASSILDGRYKQQKYRLLQSGLSRVFYLLESHCSKSSCLPQQTVDNAMWSTRTHDRLQVKHTATADETVRYLCHLDAYVRDRAQGMMDGKADIRLERTYKAYSLHSNKNGVLKVGSIFSKMLNQLRGIGSESKERILKAHATFVSFFMEIQRFKTFEEVVMYLNGTKGGSKTKVKVDSVALLERQYKVHCLELNRT